MDKLREAIRPEVRKYLDNGTTIGTHITEEIAGSKKYKTYDEVYHLYKAVLAEIKSQV